MSCSHLTTLHRRDHCLHRCAVDSQFSGRPVRAYPDGPFDHLFFRAPAPATATTATATTSTSTSTSTTTITTTTATTTTTTTIMNI